MARKHTTDRVGAWTMALALTAVHTGCATFRPLSVTGAPPTAEDPPVQPAPEPSPAETDQAALAAVQDFLERTEAYDVAALKAPQDSHAPQERNLDRRPAPQDPRTAEARPAHIRSDDAGATPGVPDGTKKAELTQSSSVAPPASTLALPVVRSVTIREPAEPEEPTGEAPQASATNEAMEMRISPPTSQVDQILADLSVRCADEPDFESEWRLRLIQLALGHDAQAAEVSTHLGQEPRTLLRALIQTATAVRQAALDPWQGGHVALERVEELRRLLVGSVDPAVTSVALCSKVVTFGVYEEMADERFVAGQAVPTIVYSQIENTQSELSEDGRYVTRLGTRLELLTAEGQSVWQHEEPEIVDTCRQKRRDFFLAQRITLPATIPAGEYVLKVFVEDKLSGRAGEAAYPLVVQSALTIADSD